MDKNIKNNQELNETIEYLEGKIDSLLNRLSEIENEADFQHRNYFYNIPAFSKIRQIARDAIYDAKF